ncbi:MAG: hypothetical protein HY288_10590 [Planctomycetia bacterium]|nr:hypothetical protein [Planctomycetia bacterium]
MGWCYYEPEARWLIWFALVPVAWVLAGPTRPVVYLAVFFGALTCHLLALDFIRQAYSGTVSSAWVVLSVLASCPWVASVIVARKLFRDPWLPMSVELPLVWVTMEFARFHFIALFTEVPFPYMQLGTLVVESEHLIQVADLAGVWLVTWLVASVNGAVFDVITVLFGRRNDSKTRRRAYVGAVATCALLAGAWLYGAWRLSQVASETGPLVALVPGNLSVVSEPSGIEKLTAEVRKTADYGAPALFVWSEGTCSGPIVTEWALPPNQSNEAIVNGDKRWWKDDESMHRLAALCQQLGAAILVGCERDEIVPGDPLARQYNSLAFATPNEGFQGCYDKIYLVPWREFRPIVALTLGLLPAAPTNPEYAGPYCPGRRCTPFSLATDDRTYRFATCICFEVAYANLHRKLMAAGHDRRAPDFFTGAANESAFRGPQYAQLSADAQRFRAIECRRAYARIATNGLSAFVDGNGQVLRAQHTTAKSGVLVGQIPIDNRYSLYVVWGDWLPIVSFLVLGWLAGTAVLRARKARRTISFPHDIGAPLPTALPI